jgi:hypothetical protein
MEAFPDEMQEIGEAIGSIWSTVWGGITDTFNKTWGGITDALAAGDMKLAFKILVAGLDVLWKGFLLGLRIGWNTFKAVFVDGWHAAVTEIELAWNDLGAGIEDVMLGVLQMVAEKFGEFFTKVLGRAADLADKVGASEFAGSLRAIGGASGADFKMARELNELDRRAKEKEIRAAAAKEQADRDAARAAALLATALDLATAKATLEALTREAANKRIERENDKMMDKFLNDMMGAFAPQRKAAMNAIASAGTFGRFDARALGIGGGKTVEDKQLDELKGLRKDVKGMRGVAWGE